MPLVPVAKYLIQDNCVGDRLLYITLFNCVKVLSEMAHVKELYLLPHV